MASFKIEVVSTSGEVRSIMTPCIDGAAIDFITAHGGAGGKISRPQHSHGEPTSKSRKTNADDVMRQIGIALDTDMGSKKSVLCPFHDDHTRSATVFAAGGFRCYAGCYDGAYLSRDKFFNQLKLKNKLK